MILDWHKWCRFCGNFEENDGIKAEIRETAEQILDVINLDWPYPLITSKIIYDSF